MAPKYCSKMLPIFYVGFTLRKGKTNVSHTSFSSLMVLLWIPDQPQVLLHTEPFQACGNKGQFSLYT